jgi:uncharacterized membrane protein
MDALQHLLDNRPLVFIHLVGALAALLIGAAVLARRKGTASHRALGWAWVAAMGTATVSSAFISQTSLPTLAGFSPIHLFTAYVAVALPRAVWQARRGNVTAHRQTMRGIYLGGCIVAGLFTLLPGRFLGQQLWPALGWA